MNIQIIRADISHAAAIASIGKNSFRKAFEHLFNNKEQLLEYLEYTYDPLKVARSLHKENNIFFLALADNEPAGFIKIKKHSLNEHIESGAQMELQKIYVHPNYQGQGIGYQLLHTVTSLALELKPDYIWLDTHISNAVAIRFYERNGFVKTGRHYFTIGNQTFEYHVMCLPVKQDILV